LLVGCCGIDWSGNNECIAVAAGMKEMRVGRQEGLQQSRDTKMLRYRKDKIWDFEIITDLLQGD
jgi:hypothetical protein